MIYTNRPSFERDNRHQHHFSLELLLYRDESQQIKVLLVDVKCITMSGPQAIRSHPAYDFTRGVLCSGSSSSILFQQGINSFNGK